MSDFKKRIEDIMLRQHAKLHKQNQNAGKPKKKNKSPEKLVVKEILAWAKGRGLDLHIVDSTAVYSKSAGMYLNSMTSESMPDILGDYNGLAIYIEAKAPGKISTLKDHQRAFLINKANRGCFACVADSAGMASSLFEAWLDLPSRDKASYLLSHLDTKKPKKEPISDLF